MTHRCREWFDQNRDISKFVAKPLKMRAFGATRREISACTQPLLGVSVGPGRLGVISCPARTQHLGRWRGPPVVGIVAPGGFARDPFARSAQGDPIATPSHLLLHALRR